MIIELKYWEGVEEEISQFGLWSYITQAKCLVSNYVQLIGLRVISINFILEPCGLSTG